MKGHADVSVIQGVKFSNKFFLSLRFLKYTNTGCTPSSTTCGGGDTNGFPSRSSLLSSVNFNSSEGMKVIWLLLFENKTN